MRAPTNLSPLGNLFNAIDAMLLEEGRTEEEILTHARQYITKLKTWAIEDATKADGEETS